jgi:hypothetical protein
MFSGLSHVTRRYKGSERVMVRASAKLGDTAFNLYFLVELHQSQVRRVLNSCCF